MLKYSRQREGIKNFIMQRCDHPTAETVYEHIREEFPHVSLGTVYRNLSLLTELGEIVKISTGTGPDRFDGNVTPHYHFSCKKCGRVIDLEMGSIEHVNVIASHNFNGHIEGSVTHFFGTCPDCLAKENSTKNS